MSAPIDVLSEIESLVERIDTLFNMNDKDKLILIRILKVMDQYSEEKLNHFMNLALRRENRFFIDFFIVLLIHERTRSNALVYLKENNFPDEEPILLECNDILPMINNIDRDVPNLVKLLFEDYYEASTEQGFQKIKKMTNFILNITDYSNGVEEGKSLFRNWLDDLKKYGLERSLLLPPSERTALEDLEQILDKLHLANVVELEFENEFRERCNMYGETEDKRGFTVDDFHVVKIDNDLSSSSNNYDRTNSLPDSIGLLQFLKELDLRKNRLVSIPETIGELKHLQILDLHWNELKKIPESIGELTQLRELDLSWNKKLTSLPETITNLTRLKYINAGFHLMTLSDKQHTWLTELYEKGCTIYGYKDELEPEIEIRKCKFCGILCYHLGGIDDNGMEIVKCCSCRGIGRYSGVEIEYCNECLKQSGMCFRCRIDFYCTNIPKTQEVCCVCSNAEEICSECQNVHNNCEKCRSYLCERIKEGYRMCCLCSSASDNNLCQHCFDHKNEEI